MNADIITNISKSIFYRVAQGDTILRDRINMLELRIQHLEKLLSGGYSSQNTSGSDTSPSADNSGDSVDPGIQIPLEDSISHVVYNQESNIVYVHTVNGYMHEYEGSYFGIIPGSSGQYTLDVPNLGLYQLYITKPTNLEVP
jgi:hypothetical protein